MPKPMLLFIPILSGKSRSELIETEKELVRAEDKNKAGVSGVRLVPSG